MVLCLDVVLWWLVSRSYVVIFCVLAVVESLVTSSWTAFDRGALFDGIFYMINERVFDSVVTMVFFAGVSVLRLETCKSITLNVIFVSF